MRYLMRLNAEKGTATKADVKGYYVGGKTGTAEKVINGRYAKNRLMTDFMAVLPADEPRYLMLIMLDEPKPIAETHGFATAGWNAAPTAAKVISRIAPLIGIEPRYDLPPADQLILASIKGQRAAEAPAKKTRSGEASPKEARSGEASPKEARGADQALRPPAASSADQAGATGADNSITGSVAGR
jgi:membrane peptidoglycan carboxypeptidase